MSNTKRTTDLQEQLISTLFGQLQNGQLPNKAPAQKAYLQYFKKFDKDQFEITVNLPGFGVEDVTVKRHNNYLVLGLKKELPNHLYNEYEFLIPDGVDYDTIKAKMSKGQLIITMKYNQPIDITVQVE